MYTFIHIYIYICIYIYVYRSLSLSLCMSIPSMALGIRNLEPKAIGYLDPLGRGHAAGIELQARTLPQLPLMSMHLQADAWNLTLRALP